MDSILNPQLAVIMTSSLKSLSLKSGNLSRKIVFGPDIIYLMMYLMTCKKAFALEFIYQKNTFHDDNAVF